MKRIISNSITVIALGVFLYAGYHIIHFGYDYYTNRQVMDELQDLYYASSDGETDYSSEQDRNEKKLRSGFDQLLSQNQDVVGWITIDNTKVDYPIVQAEDNDTYLNQNFYHEQTRAGSIFMDYRNDIEDTNNKNMIIYGHRMKDGTMFQQLTKFLDQSFVDEHTTFTLDTLYGEYDAEVFAVYQTMTDFDYIQTEFPGDASFTQFIEEVKQTSEIKTDVEVKESDNIVTLSTCDYRLDPDNGRLVVQAKLTEK